MDRYNGIIDQIRKEFPVCKRCEIDHKNVRFSFYDDEDIKIFQITEVRGEFIAVFTSSKYSLKAEHLIKLGNILS